MQRKRFPRWMIFWFSLLLTGAIPAQVLGQETVLWKGQVVIQIHPRTDGAQADPSGPIARIAYHEKNGNPSFTIAAAHLHRAVGGPDFCSGILDITRTHVAYTPLPKYAFTKEKVAEHSFVASRDQVRKTDWKGRALFQIDKKNYNFWAVWEQKGEWLWGLGEGSKVWYAFLQRVYTEFDSLVQEVTVKAGALRDSLPHYRKAEGAFAQKDYAAAEDAFLNALSGKQEPKWIVVWSYLYLGKVADLQGRRQQAIEYYERAKATGDNTNGAQTEVGAYLVRPYTGEAFVAGASLGTPTVAATRPTIELLTPDEQTRGTLTSYGSKSIAVRGRAKDSQGIFGVTIGGREASIRAIDSQTVEFWLDDVLLRPGRNDIVIVATSTARVEERLSFVVDRAEVEVAEGAASRIPDRWALIVGISKYGPTAQGIGDLKYARRDAEAFHQFLLSPQGGGFKPDHILLLTDEKATSANLRSGTRDFLGRAGENDLVIIFFAGHGAPDPARPNVLYFLTHDTDLDRLGGTGFDMEEIQIALRKSISARRVVAFVDSCHSAGVGSTFVARSGPNRIEMVNQYLHELGRTRPGVVMVTASQTNEPSFEDTRWGGGHGVFTHFVLEGLRGAADRDANGVVVLQELIDFVSERVKQDTDYKQHPTASGMTAMWDPNLPLAVLPRR